MLRFVRSVVLAFCSMVCAGCVVEPLDLEGRRCPCAEGWTCDAAANVCVRGGVDASSRDGGTDAGRADASMDAGREPDAGRDSGASDSGASDSGASDSGAIDAFAPDAPDVGTPLDETGCDDAHLDAIFCDGFESGAAMPEWEGVETQGAATAAWTAALSYRGGGAFESVTSEASARSLLNKEDSLGVFTSGEVHLRAYVYVPSAPGVENGALFFVSQAVSPWHGIAVNLLAGRELSLYIEGTGLSVDSGRVMPADEWVCLELHVQVGVAGSVALDMNGTEVLRRSGTDTTTSTGYAAFTIGLSWTDATTTAARALYDEIVFDDAPIGCD